MRKTTGMESRSRALNGKARGSKRRKATLAWRVLREVRLDSFRLCSSRRSDLFTFVFNRPCASIDLPFFFPCHQIIFLLVSLARSQLTHNPHAPSDPLQTPHYLLFPCSLLISSPEPLVVSPLYVSLFYPQQHSYHGLWKFCPSIRIERRGGGRGEGGGIQEQGKKRKKATASCISGEVVLGW